MTVTDERGKKRKMVYDFLGRLKEAHNSTAAGATYSKAVYTYDLRDLLTKIEHYDGGGAHQDRTFVYDGYGRLVSQTTPEAGTRAYTYYINDWVNTVRNDRIVTGTRTTPPPSPITIAVGDRSATTTARLRAPASATTSTARVLQ